jgi:ribosomal protein S27AE
VNVDRDNGRTDSSEDWREAFQLQAQKTLKLHRNVGCFGGVLVPVVAVSVLLISEFIGFPWYWALVAAGVWTFLLMWLRPAPWPKCPACSDTFRTLGAFCPHCGVQLPDDATPKRATCTACGYTVREVKLRFFELAGDGRIGERWGAFVFHG